MGLSSNEVKLSLSIRTRQNRSGGQIGRLNLFTVDCI